MTERNDLHRRIVETLEEAMGGADLRLEPDTEIFEVGLLDSQAIVQLVDFVEEQIGAPIDPALLNLPTDWATIDDIVHFVVEQRRRKKPTDSTRHTTRPSLPSPDNYTIIRYTSEFKESVLELQKYHWSPSLELNERYFKWKYENSPYVDQTLIYLAMSEDEVVGMRGFFGSLWEVGIPERILPALCAGDLVIAPHHRGHGIFTKIMNRAQEDFAHEDFGYLFNFSAGGPTRLSSLAIGWDSVGRVARMCLVRSPAGWKRMLHRPWNLSLEAGTSDSRLFRRLDEHRLNKPLSSCIQISAHPRPKAMADLAARLSYDGRIRHVRDEDYYEWRFENPLSVYRFVYWDDDQLDGYLVLQTSVFAQNTGWVRMIDWQAANQTILASLLDVVLRVGKFQMLEVWTETLGEETRNLLTQTGFRERAPGRFSEYYPTVLVYRVDKQDNRPWLFGGRAVLDSANWDLRLLYSDGC